VARRLTSGPNGRLQAGETQIQTHERSSAAYLLKPLRDQVARTFRER
jgi:hypothetical protein